MFSILNTSIICIISYCCTFAQENIHMGQLSAITNPRDIGELYRKISSKEPHLKPDTSTNNETKREICLSITRNAYFDKYAKQDPVEDMDTIYNQLLARAKREEEENGLKDEYSERVLENFQDGKDGKKVFTYRTRLLTMIEGYREYAFPCLTRIRSNGNHYLYFISDPYNINAALDVPTSERIQARFLCAASSNSCEPWILAEQPAITFAPPQFSTKLLEHAYLEMRKTKDAATRVTTDPLCKLKLSEKYRVCASVMNSSYFANKAVFDANPHKFSGECMFNEISFLADELKVKARGQSYKEWMLPCRVSSPEGPQNENINKFKYFVSRAYESHHVLVYRYNEDDKSWNIDTVSGWISVIIDDSSFTPGEKAAFTPSLASLLKIYHPSLDAENSPEK